MRTENSKTKASAGFTLYELLVVIAIIAVLTAIVLPNLISWRESAKLRGAVNNLTGDLQMAKSQAIKQHMTVTVQFTANGYTITDADGRVFRDREMPAGITMDSSALPVTSFNSRGAPSATGSVVIEGASDNRQISINMTGRIEVT